MELFVWLIVTGETWFLFQTTRYPQPQANSASSSFPSTSYASFPGLPHWLLSSSSVGRERGTLASPTSNTRIITCRSYSSLCRPLYSPVQSLAIYIALSYGTPWLRIPWPMAQSLAIPVNGSLQPALPTATMWDGLNRFVHGPYLGYVPRDMPWEAFFLLPLLHVIHTSCAGGHVTSAPWARRLPVKCVWPYAIPCYWSLLII